MRWMADAPRVDLDVEPAAPQRPPIG